MNLYPGIRAHMGSWTYYTVKMNMADAAKNILFAKDIKAAGALSEALQRTIDENRVKKQIVRYLQSQPDRFFNSIVIAALGGDPKWFPAAIAEDPALALLKANKKINESFGVLMFDGEERYYALDGQHRLRAIKEMMDSSSEANRYAPKDFASEEISIVIMVPEGAESESQFMVRFRRLFGHLNRYAKPMDMATSIIIDEDDVFAIVTRNLFVEHPFFKTVGADFDSKVVDTRRGSNLKEHQAHFTKLEILYEINRRLLSSNKRANGWGLEGLEIKEFMTMRPDEQEIDGYYKELADIWSAMLEAIPDLNLDPAKMKNHSVVNLDDKGEERDHLLFWPIGQKMLANLVRDRIDQAPDKDKADLKGLVRILKPLASVPWDLDMPPWKNFVLIPSDSDNADKWVMRTEQRDKVMALAESMIRALLDKSTDEDVLEDIRSKWGSYLIPAKSEKEKKELWQETLDRFNA